VDFEIEGEQMDIDKSVLDQIGDPLIHILRNAVDHGIESSQDRIQAGKNPKGRVKLSFANEGNYLLISVQDDGKGIDAKHLHKKGLEKGLLSPSQEYSDKQLLHLIFHPGFSTKESTSEISGRGVGMDVVKTNIEKLGGQVDLSTEVGKGSRFEIKIPLSLAVIEGLIVKAVSGRYVVPLNQVQETIDLEQFQIHRNKLGIGDCIEMRSKIVPLVSLDSLLDSKRVGEVPSKGIALVFEVDNQPVAVAVREVLRSQQVVIKPLGNGILSQKGWVGTCVLGDGLPSLILNPTDLLESTISESTISQRRAA
jgi:two-component system chemotaxis sensor kinase CheA